MWHRDDYQMENERTKHIVAIILAIIGLVLLGACFYILGSGLLQFWYVD